MSIMDMLQELADRTPEPEPMYWVEARPMCSECRDFEVTELGDVCQHCQAEKEQGYQVMTLAGRCANGFEMDHGKKNHAVTIGEYKARCGARPGRRSVGWSREVNKTVTCPRCIKKI